MYVCMCTCYSAPSRFLLRGAPDYSADTGSEFHAEAHEQLRVKDLPRAPTCKQSVCEKHQPPCFISVFDSISFSVSCPCLEFSLYCAVSVVRSFVPALRITSDTFNQLPYYVSTSDCFLLRGTILHYSST